MNRSLQRVVALFGVAAMAGAASTASAQSSLTISGIIDIAVQRARTFDGTYTTRMAAGFKSPRLRFVGTEDLGGGLRANFTLEEGLSVDTGSVSSFGAFHRASWLGLSSPSWGTLRLGKALVPTSRAVCYYADLHDCGGGFNNSGLFYNGTMGFGRWISVKPGRGGNNNESMSAFSGGGTGRPNSSDSGRIANAVFYDTPVFAGLQGSVAYGFGERPGDAPDGGGNHASAALTYRSGASGVTIGYEHTDEDPLWQAKGMLWTIGGQWNPDGPLRVGAVYQFERASGAAAKWTSASAWAITAAYRAGSFEPYVKVGAHRTNGVGAYGIAGGRDSSPLNVGTLYNLSKRTTLYLEYARDFRGSSAPGADHVDPHQFQLGISHTF